MHSRVKDFQSETGEALLYMDLFAGRYTANKDPYAPPERYADIYRGGEREWTETWLTTDGRWVQLTYSADEKLIPFRDRIGQAQKELGVELGRLISLRMTAGDFDAVKAELDRR